MSYTIELNNKIDDANVISGKLKDNKTFVEIFSAVVAGKDTSAYGKKVDTVMAQVKELNSRALKNDVTAKAELNELRRLIAEPLLMEEIRMLGLFGNYAQLGYYETAQVEVPVYANIDNKIQAAGQDVNIPVIRWERKAVPTITISGGHAVDYRKAALGDMYEENRLIEQIRVDIRNKAAKYVFETVVKGVENATGIKYFEQDAGLTKAGLDSVVTKVRRWGKPTITGDYALVSQINAFQGYNGVTPVANGVSQEALNELRKTGLIGMYNGAVVAEMPNPYDVSTLNTTGDNFATYLDQGIGLVLPAGVQSPVYTVTRGGITTCQGLDVTSGMEISRFDLEVGCLLVPGQEFKVGIVADENLSNIVTGN